METFSIESEDKDHHPKNQSRPKGVPSLAFLSLLGVLFCMGASIAIVVISDTQNVGSWTVQPTVQLAILSALSNVALGIAFSESVVATWWSSAANGASLKELHYIWNRGEGITFFSALAAGPSARKVARTMLALIIIKVATGPLLQRATRQELGEIVTEENIMLNITQRLPSGWTGKVAVSSASVRRITRAWWRNATIRAPHTFCDGTCEGSVLGAGMSYNCSSTTSQISLLTANPGTILFSVNTTLSQNSTGAPVVILRTLYSSAVDDNCTADITIDTCEIKAGIVEYPITLRKSIVALYFNKSNDKVHSIYTDPGDLPSAAKDAPTGPLHGLQHFGINFNSRANWRTPSTFNGNSLMARIFPSTDVDIPTRCGLQWSSPTDFVLNAMRDFMFRAAMDAADDNAALDRQTFRVRRTKPILVFHSVYEYLVAASVITLLGVLFVLIRLQGWWSLRRAVSLSPLETAKAFCAPVMERASDQNVTADGILESIGKIRVEYVDGVMVVEENDSSGTVEPLLTHS